MSAAAPAAAPAATSAAPRPRLSVGLPIYNEEGFIRAALDSLLAQDLGDFEIIVSDNQSTDRTYEICQEYADRDPRVVLVRHEKNVGAVENFRSVVRRARADYFMWAAADDTWRPEFARVLVEELDRHPEAGLAMSAVERRHDDGTLLDVVRFVGADDPGGRSHWAMVQAVTSPRKYNLFMYGVFRRPVVAEVARTLPDVLGWDRHLMLHVALATRVRYVDEGLQIKLYRSANESKYRTLDRGRFTGIHRRQLGALVRVVLGSRIIPWWRKAVLPAAFLRYTAFTLVKPYAPLFWPLVGHYLDSDGMFMSLSPLTRVGVVALLLSAVGLLGLVYWKGGLVLALLMAAVCGVGLVCLAGVALVMQTRSTLQRKLERIHKLSVAAGGSRDEVHELRATVAALRAQVSRLAESTGPDMKTGLVQIQHELKKVAKGLPGNATSLASLRREARYLTDLVVADRAADPVVDKHSLLSRYALQRREKHRQVVEFARLFEESRIRELYLEQVLPQSATVEVPVGAINELTGHANKVDMLFVCAVAKVRGARRIFEFGTYRGRTTYHLATQDAHVTTLNLHPDQAGRYAPFIGSYFKGTDREARITQIFSDARAFDTTPHRGLFDLVLVDGDHSYEGVANDTRKAFELLAPGGTVLWHDYAPKSIDLVRFFQEFTQEKPLFRIKRTSLLLHLDGVDPLTFAAPPMTDTLEQQAYEVDPLFVEELYHV